MHVEPHGLTAALRTRGLSNPTPMGAGPAGDRWVATDIDGSRWVASVVEVRSTVHRERLGARASLLARTPHPALPEVAGLLDLPRGRAVLLRREVPGSDLATVAAGRHRWRAAEVVRVVVDVAAGLEHLHRAGLVHGDVSAGNVVVTPAGRAVLVDLGWGDDVGEHGTDGPAAPERADRATSAADVHALGAVALHLLGDGHESRGPEGRSTAASPEPQPWTGDDGPTTERVTAILRTSTARDATVRPTAGELSAALRTACPPEPVVLPDSAVLARAALLRRAAGDTTQRRPRDAVRGRHRRPSRIRHAAVLGVAAAALVVTGTGAVLATDAGAPGAGATGAGEGWTPSTGAARRGSVTGSEPRPPFAPGHDDASVAAITVTHVRARALAEGDLPRLLSITVPGTPAAAADRAAWEALEGRRGRAVVTVTAAEPVAYRTADGPGRQADAVVRVQSVALLADAAPLAGPAPVTGGEPRWVELGLVRDEGRWRVATVRGVDVG